MGVRRSQHVSVSLAVKVVVALEAAVASQEALVLEAPHRLPDPELAHYFDPLSVVARENPSPGEALQLRDTVAGAILVLSAVPLLVIGLNDS